MPSDARAGVLPDAQSLPPGPLAGRGRRPPPLDALADDDPHVRRYQRHYHSSGHIWQGRYKCFPVQEDEHLLIVLRYIERNPLRAALVERAEHWPWSSLRPAPCGETGPVALDPGPAPRGEGWVEAVNAAMFEGEVQRIRTSIRRDRPLGDPTWTLATAKDLGLEYSLHPRGRPRKPAGP